MRRSFALCTAAVAVALLAGCNGAKTESPRTGDGGIDGGPAKLEGKVQVDGSSTVFPITEAVAEEFMKANPGVNVTVGSSGTGGGFKKFGRGETDISNASRPIKEGEAKAAGENGIDYVELPVAYDALSVVVHPKNDWANDITVAELKKLWEPAAKGKIMRWSQVRAGWPDRPIKLYGPGTDSGTFDYFTDAIVGEEGASRSDYTSSENDNTLVQGVASDPDALGYFGVAYYLTNKDKLKALGVDDGKADNGAGPQLPTEQNVDAGTYQPLARPVFIYVSTKAVERPEVKAFIGFYLDKVGEMLKDGEIGYIPLQAEVYQLAKKRFEERTTGSMFAGGSEVGVKLEELMSRKTQ